MQVRENRGILIAWFVLLLSADVKNDVMQQRQDQGDGDPLQPPCVTSEMMVTCKLSETHMRGSEPIRLDIVAGQTFMMTLQTISGDSVCSWNHGDNPTVPHQQRGIYFLVLPQASESDSGTYTVSCGSGSTNYSVNVTVHVEPALRRPSKPQLKIAPGGRGYSPIFTCFSEGYPRPQIKWYNNLAKSSFQNGDTIKNSGKERTESSRSSYQYSTVICCANNSQGQECTQLLDYDLTNAASDSAASLVVLSPGQPLLLRCGINSGSNPRLEWLFNNTQVHSGQQLSSKDIPSTYMKYLFIDSVSVYDSGEYTCRSNKFNHTKSTRVQVLEQGFINILQLNDVNSILAKDKPTFCFRALVFSYPQVKCHWVAPNGRRTQCHESKRLRENSTFELCDPDPGEYQLHLENSDRSIIRNLSLCVTGVPAFSLFQDENSVTCLTNSSLPLELTWKTCPSFSNSLDHASWKEISVSPSEWAWSDSDQFCQKLISSPKPRKEVENHLVKCCITNVAGPHCSEQILVQKPSISFVLLVMCGVLVLALLLVSIALMHFIRKKKPVYQSQLQMIQVVGPLDNDYIYIDFKDFKYDQKWEFPRENLELGRELGSGAFGMVVQATAYGISKPGVSLQVAVKMLKDKHQPVEKEALMSELKMLTHIGSHNNIVNLLGACTGSGPAYLIFQYCCNGDLLNYLKSNRECFHKSLTDAFKKDRFSGLYHSYQTKKNSSEFLQPNDNPYVPMSPTMKHQESVALFNPNSTSIDTTEGIFEVSDDLQEEDLQALTYDDLLSFSYQVAKGMEFLSSKNCIHRDLAARNVLVTQGRLVKIGDFGLARDIDNDNNYVVRGNVRLPVKWMAPESIFKGMYTMQSDTWAYGILLWEIFSLGVTPYPGMKVDNHFYALIERGFQMEQPYYCTASVYNMMRCCWALEPQDRPRFSKLLAFIENELADMEEKLYHNVSEQSYSDSVYQNAWMTSDLMGEAKDQEGFQTSPNGSI